MFRSGGDLLEFTSWEQLQKILECPVCQGIQTPPIYNCSKGHTVCGSCRRRLSKCPVCNGPLTDSRNFALESIIQTSKFICDYYDNGCKSVVSGGTLQKHQHDCEFRPLKCHLGRMDGCNQSIIEFPNYFQHLLKVHKMTGGNEESGDTFVIRQTFTESGKSKQNWLCTYKKFDGQVFLTRSFKDGPNFYWSLAIIGNDLEAGKYEVAITIDKANAQAPKYQVIIPVLSIRKSKVEILEQHSIAMLMERSLRGFCSKINMEDNTEKIMWRTQYQILKRDVTHL